MADPVGGKGQLADMGEYFAAKLFQFVIITILPETSKEKFQTKLFTPFTSTLLFIVQ